MVCSFSLFLTLQFHSSKQLLEHRCLPRNSGVLSHNQDLLSQQQVLAASRWSCNSSHRPSHAEGISVSNAEDVFGPVFVSKAAYFAFVHLLQNFIKCINIFRLNSFEDFFFGIVRIFPLHAAQQPRKPLIVCHTELSEEPISRMSRVNIGSPSIIFEYH